MMWGLGFKGLNFKHGHMAKNLLMKDSLSLDLWLSNRPNGHSFMEKDIFLQSWAM